MVPHLGVSGEGSPAVDAAACSDPLALCSRESLATVDIALRTAMRSSVHLDDGEIPLRASPGDVATVPFAREPAGGPRCWETFTAARPAPWHGIGFGASLIPSPH
jgi:hypothetical protein